MSNTRTAKRYASALMDLASGQKAQKTIVDDLMFLKTTIAESHDLRRFLASPVIPKEKKKTVLQEIFRKKISETTRQYLGVIVEKGRERLLPEILEQYFVLRDESLGILHVQVHTAAEFSTQQEKTLVRKLESFTDKKIKITFSIDKSLKGGFVARVADTMFDASVQHQLELMKARLKDGSMNSN
jgi:F-type H+-transporting ATPase subunit delta